MDALVCFLTKLQSLGQPSYSSYRHPTYLEKKRDSLLKIRAWSLRAGCTNYRPEISLSGLELVLSVDSLVQPVTHHANCFEEVQVHVQCAALQLLPDGSLATQKLPYTYRPLAHSWNPRNSDYCHKKEDQEQQQ